MPNYGAYWAWVSSFGWCSMDLSVLFRLAILGILTAMVNMLLKKSDKDDIATLVNLAALVIALLTVLDMVAGLFDNIRSIFELY